MALADTSRFQLATERKQPMSPLLADLQRVPSTSIATASPWQKSSENDSIKTSASKTQEEILDGSFDQSLHAPGVLFGQELLGGQVGSISVRSFQNSHKYKTEICKNYELNKFCKWGPSCCFAHGREELRSKVLVNHFYKTKICRHFHKNGFCPYASRCQYFHFKTNEIFSELLDAFQKKVAMKMADSPSESLEAILSKSERM